MRYLSRRRFLVQAGAWSVIGAEYAVESFNLEASAAGTHNRTRYRDHQNPGRYRGKQIVPFKTAELPGTIIIETSERALYFVQNNGMAIAYGIGVGRSGFRWSGTATVGRKAEWPAWHPPKEMIERELRRYGRRLPQRMEGGPDNPLGARALYLFQGEKDTLYRIHGTNAPKTIGRAVSSGCIRMLNDEVIDLYDRVDVGAKVIVR